MVKLETKARIEPLAAEAMDERTRAVLGETVTPVAQLEEQSARGGAPAILRTIAHHPTLLEPFLAFAATLATRGVLTRRDSELLALRTAWRCQSAFEWGHHVIYARAAGLGEREIERCTGDAGDPAWAEHERALLAAADELIEGHDVSDGTWSRLRSHFEDAQLVEIPFVVGQYTMLSMVARATGVPLEPDLPRLPPGSESPGSRPVGYSGTEGTS